MKHSNFKFFTILCALIGASFALQAQSVVNVTSSATASANDPATTSVVCQATTTAGQAVALAGNFFGPATVSIDISEPVSCINLPFGRIEPGGQFTTMSVTDDKIVTFTINGGGNITSITPPATGCNGSTVTYSISGNQLTIGPDEVPFTVQTSVNGYVEVCADAPFTNISYTNSGIGFPASGGSAGSPYVPLNAADWNALPNIFPTPPPPPCNAGSDAPQFGNE